MTTTVNTINGTEGNNRLTGTSGNDVINGNGGNDRINGGSGSDTLNGGAGKDELNGGSGNDVLDGGSGSDELEGGSGNDTLIYTLAENNVICRTTYDEYEGGSGTDTLELRFTRAEWMNDDNQKMLQRYIDWASKSGSSCRWDDDFTFRFGNARLEIEDIEKLVVKVDDEFIDNVGNNMVKLLDDEIKITEDDTSVRKIDVLDNDSVNYLVKDLKLETGPAKGSVVLVKDNPNNANTWYFNYTPDSNYYQNLIKDEPATESFTYKVTDAKGLSAIGTVNVKIEGLNDDAEIRFSPPNRLSEDGVLTKLPSSQGNELVDSVFYSASIRILDKDSGQSELSRIESVGNNLGKITIDNIIYIKDSITNQVIQSEIQYTYSVENSKLQYFNDGLIKLEDFKIYSADDTFKIIRFEVAGRNDAAVIGDPTNTQVTEDAGNIVDGFITLTGDITITDVDKDEAIFQTQVTSSAINKGSLTLQSNGSYTYKVSNADLQSLNASDHPIDEFTIFAKDGTEKTIRITINGADDVVNSAPVVKELGQGDNKYAGSANVEELINLRYDNSIIAKYVAKGGDFDYLHVRTGQFSFSDSDLTDTFKITSKAAGLEGNLGTLTFDNYTNAKDSSGNIIDGEYIVKWTYTVKDSDLDSLNTPATGISSKDDDFIVTINDGTTTKNTKLLLNLFGRNEIDFVEGFDFGNNVYEATDGTIFLPAAVRNDVLYLGGGDTYMKGDFDSVQVVYGENGNDEFIVNSQNTVFFGGEGDDQIELGTANSNALIFGGNGNDLFFYLFDLNLQGRKSYAWGGAGSDFFDLRGNSSKSINWVMDFDSRNPLDGGDKINFRFNGIDSNWTISATNIEKKSADDKHPFLSEGAEYYDLQINRGADVNNPIWLSVLNLVGVNGTEITLQGLIDNKNLV